MFASIFSLLFCVFFFSLNIEIGVTFKQLIFNLKRHCFTQFRAESDIQRSNKTQESKTLQESTEEGNFSVSQPSLEREVFNQKVDETKVSLK